MSPQLDLIHKVLVDAGRPLTPLEILDHAKSMGVWITDAKQPWTVIHSRISVDIRKAVKSGGVSSFIRTNSHPATFAVHSVRVSTMPPKPARIGDQFKYRKIPLTKLIGFEANPSARTDTKTTNLNDLRETIEEHGLFQDLIVVDNGDGTYTTADGHRRRATVEELGWSSIQCKVYPVGTPIALIYSITNGTNRRHDGKEWLEASYKSDQAVEPRGRTKKDIDQAYEIFEEDIQVLVESNVSAGVVKQVNSLFNKITDYDVSYYPNRKEIGLWLVKHKQQLPVRFFIEDADRHKRLAAAMKKLVMAIKRDVPLFSKSKNRQNSSK